MELLKRLSEVPGAPGREARVRDLIRAEVEGHCDRIEEDAMGNLLCLKRATRAPEDGDEPTRVMIACHMDEIGFYVRHIDDNGFLWLRAAGYFDVRHLFARRVQILGRRDVIGVLNPSGLPSFLQTGAGDKLPDASDFFVDTGMSADDVRACIRPGDPVCLVQTFSELGDCVTGKALDNRVACWVGVRVLQTLGDSPHDVHVVFTVQEEIGGRGAQTSAYRIEPDFGIAIDTTMAFDVPGVGPEKQVTRLGGGVAIKVLDSASVSDPGLVERSAEIAERREIPHQFEVLPRGGTDAGPVQLARMGCRALTLSIPTRYIHTTTETIHPADLHATLELLVALLEDGLAADA